MKVIKSFSSSVEIIQEFESLIGKRKFSDVVSFLLEKYIQEHRIQKVYVKSEDEIQEEIKSLELKLRDSREKKEFILKAQQEEKDRIIKEEQERLIKEAQKIKEEEENRKSTEELKNKKIHLYILEKLNGNEEWTKEYIDIYGLNKDAYDLLNFMRQKFLIQEGTTLPVSKEPDKEGNLVQ